MRNLAQRAGKSHNEIGAAKFRWLSSYSRLHSDYGFSHRHYIYSLPHVTLGIQ